jgi:hypothetical protein
MARPRGQAAWPCWKMPANKKTRRLCGGSLEFEVYGFDLIFWVFMVSAF